MTILPRGIIVKGLIRPYNLCLLRPINYGLIKGLLVKKLTLFFLIVVILLGSFWIYLNQNYATPILMYHSLDKSKVDTYAAVDPEVFRRQMEFIKAGSYKVVSLW